MSLPTTTIYASTMSSPTASPTSTSTSSSGSTVDSQKSPLLFFVALGFGVLFTNLWIIIGVKYCFRYQNARRRGMTMNEVAMEQMGHRRRRREKKLMTQEEVDDRFPLQTYKNWRADRERAGLSTAGGVASVDADDAQQARDLLNGKAPSVRAPSRPASLHGAALPSPAADRPGSIYEVGSGGEQEILVDGRRQDLTVVGRVDSQQAVEGISHASPSKGTLTTSHRAANPSMDSRRSTEDRSVQQRRREDEDAEDEEEDDAVEANLADDVPQHLPDDIASGDNCAICIDTLEDEDQIRGLSCGHAFHGTCVDVWLTTRRAICPLCKRDFYVRKAQEGTAALDENGDPIPERVETREERRERRRQRRQARAALLMGQQPVDAAPRSYDQPTGNPNALAQRQRESAEMQERRSIWQQLVGYARQNRQPSDLEGQRQPSDRTHPASESANPEVSLDSDRPRSARPNNRGITTVATITTG
ncbi:hypothetical protein PYCC9005_003006 [Savitreella phatthalungensis]